MRPALADAARRTLDRQADPEAPAVTRPQAQEHDPYYARYIGRVPEGDLLPILRRQTGEVTALFGLLSEEQAAFAYAPGKWRVKDVLGHLADVERVFAFRAACFARGDRQPLPSFDPDAWAAAASSASRSCSRLLDDWLVIRAASVALVEGLPPEALLRGGVASNAFISVRALLYVLPGHVDHHLAVVRERYQAAPAWPRRQARDEK